MAVQLENKMTGFELLKKIDFYLLCTHFKLYFSKQFAIYLTTLNMSHQSVVVIL